MKVIITDDSIIMRNILREALEAEGIEVSGEAVNGKKAVELNRETDADAMIMDINMPIMNGLEATKIIMKEKPLPIVVFSNEVDPNMSFEALRYGAVEVIRKPDIDAFNNPNYMKEFIKKLRAVSHTHPGASGGTAAHTGLSEAGEAREIGVDQTFEAVVIGASTGGPIAVREVLKRLPGDFPVGIALVQHIEDRFDTGYASWLNDAGPLKVEIAAPRDVFVPGHVKVAPGNRHLICRERMLVHDDGPKVDNQKPSVNRLFETSAECYGNRLIGVLLTGMGTDGGRGCGRIKKSGGYTVVQNEATSLIYGMPKTAVELGGASVVLALDEIASYLVQLVGKNG